MDEDCFWKSVVGCVGVIFVVGLIVGFVWAGQQVHARHEFDGELKKVFCDFTRTTVAVDNNFATATIHNRMWVLNVTICLDATSASSCLNVTGTVSFPPPGPWTSTEKECNDWKDTLHLPTQSNKAQPMQTCYCQSLDSSPECYTDGPKLAWPLTVLIFFSLVVIVLVRGLYFLWSDRNKV